MRLTSLRSISIAGGTATRPISDRIGSCDHHHGDHRDQDQEVAADRIDQHVQEIGDGFGAGGHARQKFRRMPLGEEADAFAHQLGKQLPLVVGENGVLIFDRITVWP